MEARSNKKMAPSKQHMHQLTESIPQMFETKESFSFYYIRATHIIYDFRTQTTSQLLLITQALQTVDIVGSAGMNNDARPVYSCQVYTWWMEGGFFLILCSNKMMKAAYSYIQKKYGETSRYLLQVSNSPLTNAADVYIAIYHCNAICGKCILLRQYRT